MAKRSAWFIFAAALILAGCGNDKPPSRPGEVFNPVTIEFMSQWGDAPSGVFRRVEDLALDATGNLYLADNGLDRIQKLGPGGDPLGVWYRSARASLGDAPRIDVAPDGRVYLSTLRQILRYAADGGPETEIYTSPPGILILDVAVGPEGNLWILTSGGESELIELDSEGGELQRWTVAPSALSAASSRIGLDGDGLVYLLKAPQPHVTVLGASGSVLASWNLPPTEFTGKMSLAVTPGGTIFVHDSRNSRVLKYASDGELLAEWPYSRDEHPWHESIALDGGGRPYLYDAVAGAVDRLDPETGEPARVAASLDVPYLFSPGSIAVDGAGRVIVQDSGGIKVFQRDGTPIRSIPVSWRLMGYDRAGERIVGRSSDPERRLQAVDVEGNLLLDVAAPGSGCDVVKGPAVDSRGVIYIAVASCLGIARYDAAGRALGAWYYGPDTSYPMAPWALGVDAENRLLVLSRGHGEIVKIASDGRRVGAIPLELPAEAHGIDSYGDIAVDAAGRVYLVEATIDRVQAYGPDGGLLATWGGSGVGAGQFRYPQGITVTPEGTVLVADQQNRRVQEFRVTEVGGE